MPKLKDNRVHSYRLHKQSGEAIVTRNVFGATPSRSTASPMGPRRARLICIA